MFDLHTTYSSLTQVHAVVKMRHSFLFPISTRTIWLQIFRNIVENFPVPIIKPLNFFCPLPFCALKQPSAEFCPLQTTPSLTKKQSANRKGGIWEIIVTARVFKHAIGQFTRGQKRVFFLSIFCYISCCAIGGWNRCVLGRRFKREFGVQHVFCTFKRYIYHSKTT